MRMRWMDDLVVAAEDTLSNGAKRAIGKMTKKEAYGEGLELVRTELHLWPQLQKIIG